MNLGAAWLRPPCDTDQERQLHNAALISLARTDTGLILTLTVGIVPALVTGLAILGVSTIVNFTRLRGVKRRLYRGGHAPLLKIFDR